MILKITLDTLAVTTSMDLATVGVIVTIVDVANTIADVIVVHAHSVVLCIVILW